MSNWQTRYPGNQGAGWSSRYDQSRDYDYGGGYGGNADHYGYQDYELYDQGGRRFERKRNYRPSGREGYYKSRVDNQDAAFSGGFHNPAFTDPHYQPSGGYLNNGFVSEEHTNVYDAYSEPDYPDSDDDVTSNQQHEVQPNQPGPARAQPVQAAAAPAAITADAQAPPPTRPKRTARWDVFGETAVDVSTSQSEKRTWKIINAVMRLVVAIVFFFFIFVTAITSRLTLLLMTYNVRPGADNFTIANQGRQHVLKEATGRVDLKWVWALILVVTAPYVFTTVSCLWKLIFKKTEPLRCGPLLAALLVETLHSLGLCTLVFYVLPSFDPVIGCLMLCNIAFFPGLIQIFQSDPKTQAESSSERTEVQKSQDGESPRQSAVVANTPKGSSSGRRVVRKVLDVLMLLLHVGSMAVWSYRAYDVMDDVILAVLIPAAMLLTSLSWWDNYVSGKKPPKKTRKASAGSTKEATPPTPNGDVAPNGDSGPAPAPAPANRNSAATSPTKKTNFLTALKRSIKKRRTRITLSTSLWKILLTIAYPAVTFGYGSQNCYESFFLFHEKPRISLGPGGLVKHPLAVKCSMFTPLDLVDEMTCHEYYPLLVAAVNVGCSILCYKIGKSACKVLLQIPCFVMPLVLTPPATLILLVASYVDVDDFHMILGCQVPWFRLAQGLQIGDFLKDFIAVYWVPAGFAAYLSLLYICGHVWTPRAERMSRTDKLFCKPLYCGVLMDQSLMLNRRPDEDDPAEHRLAGRWMDEVSDVGGLALDEARSALRKDTTPLIYICATMWHESETEMVMMLKSIFRLDADQSARKNAQLYFNITDPDYYEFEAHIFFDDAFQGHNDKEFEYTVNDFVKQLVRVMDHAASAVHSTELRISKPRKIPTPYGGRLVWRLPGGNLLIAHMKDKAKIRHRKRWSQVMYMYYFLGYKLISQEGTSLLSKKIRGHNTFLLALDGDVDFQPDAVQILVDRMKQTPELGAACGRIHPIGSGPMVWYQKFEYAVSHWLQKATEHILGCVLCSPGCFSLFRGSALMDDNVMKRYTTPPSEARHYVQYDQGEDRWLCTLLLQQGYRVEYCAASDSYTFAPEGFYEFYNQRRRWTPSTMANIIDLLQDWRNTTKNNQDISVLFIGYQLFLLASGIITPGTIFLLIVGAISTATQDAIPLWAGLLINAIPIFLFVVLCYKAGSATQLAYAGILSMLYTIVMMLVLVGIIRGAAENGLCSVSTTFLLGVVSVFVITALLHPMECTDVLHGFLYFLSIPSMSMLLMLYSLSNLHNVSWGTREVKSAAPPPPQQGQQAAAAEKKGQNSNFIKEALSRLADTHNAESDYAFSFGNLFRCLCCPREGASPNDNRFQTIMKSIEVLDDKVTQMTSVTSGVGDSLHGVSELSEDSLPDSPPADSPKKFSAVPELFEGAVEKVNPLFKKTVRDELKNPMWSEDKDLGAGPMEFVEEEEKEFWVKFIGQYLFPLDKDEKHEKAVQAELLELRNKMSMAFLLINTLFVVLISSLQIISESTTNLSVEIPCGRNTSFTGEKIEPISVTFTVVFGIMLTLQFFAMMFHRFSTMLHIISITEIKFKRLTRQVLGMTTSSEEMQPTVEETINLVREMQAIRPETPPAEPEADYGDDLDTPAGTAARKKSGSELWNKLNSRSQRVNREQTLSRAFMRNFEKLANHLRTESTTENSPVQLEADVRENFRNLQRKSLHTIVKMAKDTQYKDHILKRSREARRNWRRGFAKLRGGKFQFRNLVQEAKERKEEEEEEDRERIEQSAAAAAASATGGLLSPSWSPSRQPAPSTSAASSFRNRSRQRVPGEETDGRWSEELQQQRAPPSPTSSFRNDGSWSRQQVPEDFGGQFSDGPILHTDFPAFRGGNLRGSPLLGNRFGSGRHSQRSGFYNDPDTDNVFFRF